MERRVSDKVEIEFELDEDLIKRLQELANEMGITFDELIEQILTEELDKPGD